jgi:hypothetical protein
MIKIEGFTELQRDLADRLWKMDTEREAREFVDSLPRNLKREAWVVIMMIMAHELDEVDVISPDLQQYLRSL